MKSRNISAAQFADEIGVQRSSVSHILTGRNNPSLDIILKILQRFPEINSDWILTGNGAMLKSDNVKRNTISESKSMMNLNEKDLIEKKPNMIDLFGSLNIETERANTLYKSTKPPIVIKPEEIKNEEIKTDNGEKIKNPEEDKISNSFRIIDKIVIFYSDNTFSLFTPNN